MKFNKLISILLISLFLTATFIKAEDDLTVEDKDEKQYGGGVADDEKSK